MEAVRTGNYTFTVVGDYEDTFVHGRRVKAYCGTDGYKYGTVQETTYPYDTTKSLVTLETNSSDQLTANMVEIAWSKVKPGLEGNQSPKIQSGNYLVQLMYDSGEALLIHRKGLASDSATDFFNETITRSRGSLSTPGNVVDGDKIYRQRIRTYVNSGWYDALLKEIEIEDVTGSNIVTKETETGKGTSGSSYIIQRKYGTGVIDYPSQSRARVTKATATSVAATSTTLASWSVEDYDPQAEMALGSGVFTAGYAGGYHIDVMRTFACVGTSTSAGTYEIQLWKNGTAQVAKATGYKGDEDGIAISVLLSCDIELSADDYLEVYLYQNSGASVNSGADVLQNYWNVQKKW